MVATLIKLSTITVKGTANKKYLLVRVKYATLVNRWRFAENINLIFNFVYKYFMDIILDENDLHCAQQRQVKRSSYFKDHSD